MRNLLVPVFAGLLATLSLAQTGTLDQVSPYPGSAQTAGFNGSASSLIWQCQVRCGLAGTLEGFNLRLNGSQGSHIDTRIRRGDGWNTTAVLHSGVAVKTNSTFNEVVFIDTSAANIQLAVGETFVIELQGRDDGGGLLGTYAPPPGIPQYPEFLYLNGPGCFVDCGWRIAFDTYMLTGPSAPVVYCTPGTTSSGCTASISASGNPNVSHTAPCQINVTGVEGQKSGIVFYGLASGTQPWCSIGGTSLLCVKAPTGRTGTQTSGGTIGACDGTLSRDWNAYMLANPGALGQPWAAGSKAYVQAWFRDPPSCKTTSLSDAVELTYVP
jgi:hypothetical protein